MARGKKRHFIEGRSYELFADSIRVSPSGIFKNVTLEDAGFSPEAINGLNDYGINTLGRLLQKSSAELRHYWYLKEYVNEILDTLDDYFFNEIERRKKEYYDSPVPVYKLLGLTDISRYANILFYDFNKRTMNFVAETFSSMRANGIITLQDFLKMDLVTYHGFYECSDKGVRFILCEAKKGLRSVSKMPLMPDKLDPPGKTVLTYPIPEDSRAKIASLTDDRIAGDKVSTRGLSTYEKALYERSRDAIDDCGPDFYYDVADNKELFRGLAQGLAEFYAPEIELMQRKAMIRKLYLSVPERFKMIPVRFLCHYMRPRSVEVDKEWPYREYYDTVNVVFFSSWEAFRKEKRMLSLEAAYDHLEELMNSCSTIEELDNLIKTDRDEQFMDLLHWLSHATMLNAVYDTFMNPYKRRAHEAPDEMRRLIPETDPDEVLARFAEIMDNSDENAPAEILYYHDDYSGSVHDSYYACRYDFFAVYMLLTGKISVPADIADAFLYVEDSESLIYYLRNGGYSFWLYEFNKETGMLTIKDSALL